jgi:hypothetical protein
LKQEGLVVHERTIRRTLRALDYRYKRPRYVLARTSPTWRQQKGGRERHLKGRKRTVILFSDEVIISQTPALRAAWGPIGEPIGCGTVF